MTAGLASASAHPRLEARLLVWQGPVPQGGRVRSGPRWRWRCRDCGATGRGFADVSGAHAAALVHLRDGHPDTGPCFPAGRGVARDV